jgi:hypothetical protein
MRYMLLFRGLAAAPHATDEQTLDYNRQWGEWIGRLASRDALVASAPFQPRGAVVASDSVRELELAPIDIGGFALIEATEDEAVEIAGQAPHIALGGTTVVRPVVDLGPRG